jgi:hypothetical protein
VLAAREAPPGPSPSCPRPATPHRAPHPHRVRRAPPSGHRGPCSGRLASPGSLARPSLRPQDPKTPVCGPDQYVPIGAKCHPPLTTPMCPNRAQGGGPEPQSLSHCGGMQFTLKSRLNFASNLASCVTTASCLAALRLFLTSWGAPGRVAVSIVAFMCKTHKMSSHMSPGGLLWSQVTRVLHLGVWMGVKIWGPRELCVPSLRPCWHLQVWWWTSLTLTRWWGPSRAGPPPPTRARPPSHTHTEDIHPRAHPIRSLAAVNFLITARSCSWKILTPRRNNGTNKIKIKKLIILCVCNLIKDAVKFYCFPR